MTDAITHLKQIAQRYAMALVNYHITKSGDDYSTLCEIQEIMNEVAQEVAAETGC